MMKGAPFTIRLEESTLEKVMEAALEGETKTAAIERLVLDGLERNNDTDVKSRAESSEAALETSRKALEAANDTISTLRSMMEWYGRELEAKNDQILKLTDAVSAAQVSQALTIAASRPRLLERVRALFAGKPERD